MASGYTRKFSGAYIGTGVALDIEVIGWKPDRVELINVDDADVPLILKTDMMPDDEFFMTKAGANSIVAAGQGITLTDKGFSVGTDADLNTSGETVKFVAFGI